MGLLGNLLMYAAVASVIITVISGILGERKGDAGLIRNAERATYATAIFTTGAVLALQMALITIDFSLQYVSEYTSSTLSIPYRIGSMWAGMGGSLLLWAWIVALTAAWMVYANKRRNYGVSAWAYGIASLYAGLFVMMSLYNSSGGPFDASTGAVAEGMGLNPLLQDPLQLIHPLFLYGGYVLYTLPFAVIVGQLIDGKVEGAEWIRFARAWAIISWLSLTIGIVLGARWAYAELGWGGYWAWDPVENASLIPWLTGTAVLHLGLSHRGRRDRLRMRSAIMLMVTFALCLFGTFLTRSGVIQSVHAFGESNLGPILGGAILVTALGSGALFVWRLPQLQYRDENAHSRGWFGQMLLTVLLSVMTIAVTWGTLYPLFARAFLGQEIAVTPGFFKVVVTPMGVALLVIFALSPFLKDQRIENVAREAAIRAIMFGAIFGVVFFAFHFTHPGVAFTIAVSALAVRTVLWKSRRPIGAAMKSEQDKWWNVAHASSPYFGHLGLIIMLAAITLNVVGEVRDQTKIEVGQTKTVAGISIKLDSVQVQEYPDRASFQAFISVLDDEGGVSANIVSKLERFNNAEQLQAQVGISSGIMRDVYVVVDEADATPGAQWTRLTVYNNPWINWIWFGGGLLSLAGLFYLIPTIRRRRVPVAGAAAVAAPVADPEFGKTIDTAILAVQAGIWTTANDRVNATIASARDIAGGEAASTDAVVAVLERLRGAAAPAAKGSSLSLNRNQMVGLGVAVVLLASMGGYVVSNLNSSAVPGITGEPTSTAPANGIDEAKVAEYMAAITANPKDAVALWNLGNIYFDAQEYGTAVTFYDKLTAVTPTDANVWIAAGAAAFNNGDDAKAFEDWTQATKVDPKNVEARYNLGFWYLSQEPSQELKAKTEWEKVVELAPDSDFASTVKSHLEQLGSVTVSPSATPSATGAALTAAVVAKHKTATDCWTIVDGKVYDVTKWIALHPGGQPVIQAMCGIDSTAAFTGQHSLSGEEADKLAAYLLGAVGSPAP